jgi:hypothetical protein
MRTAGTIFAALIALSAAAQDQQAKCRKCGNDSYGTSIEWAESPNDAAKKARAEEKLVFVLHVSGNFEDPRFT